MSPLPRVSSPSQHLRYFLSYVAPFPWQARKYRLPLVCSSGAVNKRLRPCLCLLRPEGAEARQGPRRAEADATRGTKRGDAASHSVRPAPGCPPGGSHLSSRPALFLFARGSFQFRGFLDESPASETKKDSQTATEAGQAAPRLALTAPADAPGSTRKERRIPRRR